MVKKDFIPILKCEIEESGPRKGMIRVWCPFCLKYHRHGSPGNDLDRASLMRSL
jgi:hypothetical protein